MRIVEDSPEKLVVKDQSNWLTAVCFAAAAFLVGFAILGNGQHTNVLFTAAVFAAFGAAFLRGFTAEFDKVQQVCKLSSFNIIRRTKRTIPFSEVDDVKLEADRLNIRSQARYRLVLTSPSGPIPLGDSYDAGLAHFESVRQAILNALARTEGPEVETDPVQDLVEQGRIADAVALLCQRENLDLTAARNRVAEMQSELNRH